MSGPARRVPLPAEIAEGRVIAILRGLPAAACCAVSGELRGAGIGVIEVTMQRSDAAAAIARLRDEASEGRLVGAGTVLDERQAADAVAAGAQFLVMPHVDERLVAWAAERGVPALPGAATPTEILRAWRAGASAVKLFPARSFEASSLGDLLGPLEGIPLVPTGGIDAARARAFMEAGAVAVGVGGWLTSAGAALAARACELLAAVSVAPALETA